MSENPAISIIIPMYNVEKYIGECLDSILNQTFQNFEVIVIDDCSTDRSVEIVQNYAQTFGGRLKLGRTNKNSNGGGYLPRNIGLSIARGEYVFFVDSDDFILLTALETLHAAAKKNKADVVYFSEYYRLNSPNDIRKVTDGEGKTLLNKGIEDKPTLTVNAPNKILEQLLHARNFCNPWTKFIRRELLINNKITFPQVFYGGDHIWSIDVYTHAKKFLRIQNPLYFYRSYSTGSVTRTKKTFEEQIPFTVSAIIVWLREFQIFAGKNEILKKNPEFCYMAAEHEIKYRFNVLTGKTKPLLEKKAYENLKNSIEKEPATALIKAILKYIDGQLRLINVKEELGRSSADGKFAISVIIPMYNAEKYIGECLDSLISQTFQSFEVIVVDDGSKDSSNVVVASRASKFDERMTIIKLKKNSGGAGKPRNMGLEKARGEYVIFIDADDVFTETALEEMYFLGKQHDSDVVYCEKYYISAGIGQKFKENAKISERRLQKPPFVDKPTLEFENLSERVEKAIKGNYSASTALKLVKRDMLIESKITFPLLAATEDTIWSFKVLFCAKKFLRIPNACFIFRLREDSIMFSTRTTPEYIRMYMEKVVRCMKEMDNFMGAIAFFSENSLYRYAVLRYFLQSSLFSILKRCENLSKDDIYGIFLKNFGEYLGNNDVLASLLFTRMIIQRKKFADEQKALEDKNQQRINELEAEVKRLKAGRSPN